MRLSAPLFRLKREARLLSREASLPLHAALDHIARREGFRSWSHLVSAPAAHRPAEALLSALVPGDLLLLAARPGQGKTLLGLELAVAVARGGGESFFFTLEYTERDVLQRFADLGIDPAAVGPGFHLDTADDLCAGRVIERLRASPGPGVAVIDYLQLLDQRRSNPPLAEQVAALRAFAAESGAVVVLIAQIDRAFDLRADAMPGLADVRLPNPIDLGLFTKACFLHGGELRLERVAFAA